MRKILLSLAAAFLLAANAHSQLLVVDTVVSAILSNSGVEQAVHYAQQAMEWVETAQRFEQQLNHWKFQINQAAQNIASARDIKGWDDFTNWYNRQLYLEKKTVETFDNLNVSIGGKNYKITDIEGIVYGAKDTYVDYWDREFTEEQRRAMWLNLGLTPSNYAYVQPFREKGRELSRAFLASSEIQNEWYVRNMERNNERQERLAEDKNLADEDKMGEKEVLMELLESSMENNKVLNDIAMNQTMQMEMQAVQFYLDQTPADSPSSLSEWPEDVFRPLVGRE